MSRYRSAVLAAVVSLSTSAAHATVIEGTFSGAANGFGATQEFQDLIHSPMTGSFMYDTALAVQTGTHTFAFTSGAEITMDSAGMHEHAVGTAERPLVLTIGSQFRITGGQPDDPSDYAHRFDGFRQELHLSSINNADVTWPTTDFAWLPLMDQQSAYWRTVDLTLNTIMVGFNIWTFELHTVPEPGTLSLLLAPLAIGVARRSARRMAAT